MPSFERWDDGNVALSETFSHLGIVTKRSISASTGHRGTDALQRAGYVEASLCWIVKGLSSVAALRLCAERYGRSDHTRQRLESGITSGNCSESTLLLLPVSRCRYALSFSG